MRKKHPLTFSFWLILMVITSTMYAAEIKTVHFVEESNWPPFTPNVEGKVTHGLSYELMKEIFSRLNIEVELELFPQKRMLYYLEKGLRDGATVISKNAERMKYIDYSESIFLKLGLLYYRSNREPPLEWQTYSDLSGLTIGIIAGHNYGNEFNDAVKKNKIQVETVISIENNFKKIIRNRIDALLCIQLTAQSLLKNPEYQGKIIPASKPYYEKNYYIGFSKFTKAKVLIPKVNQVIRQMKKDGSLKRILAQYIE